MGYDITIEEHNGIKVGVLKHHGVLTEEEARAARAKAVSLNDPHGLICGILDIRDAELRLRMVDLFGLHAELPAMLPGGFKLALDWLTKDVEPSRS